VTATGVHSNARSWANQTGREIGDQSGKCVRSSSPSIPLAATGVEMIRNPPEPQISHDSRISEDSTRTTIPSEIAIPSQPSLNASHSLYHLPTDNLRGLSSAQFIYGIQVSLSGGDHNP